MAPFGYKNVEIDKRHKTIEKLEFKANIAALKMYELYATGTFSYKSLMQRIEADYDYHFPDWSAIGVILKNRFYIGEMYDKATDTYYPHDYEQFIPADLTGRCRTSWSWATRKASMLA